MAKASGIRAGQAFVEIFADNSRLVRGLKQASARLRSWGRSVQRIGLGIFAAGSAMLGSMLLAVRQFMEAGDALDKMSARVGVSVEFLSALSHAAQLGGTDLATMEASIRRLQRSAYDATRGLSTATDAFAALGVEVRGADGQLKSTEQLFMESATALSQLENETQKAALATMLFGQAGTQLLPMLKGGRDGLMAMMEEAKELGIVMSTEDATAAAELTDAWTRLKTSLNMTVIRIGGALAPMLTELAKRVRKVVSPVIEWIKENRTLVVTVAKLAAIVTAAGAALLAVSAVLFGLGTVFGALAGVFAFVGTAISLVISALSAMISPVGLVVAAVASLGAYLAQVSGAGSKSLAWLGEQFQALKSTAASAWQGIANALAAGDIALAAEILWLSLKLAWQKGIKWLTDKWIAFQETFGAVATEAWYGLAKILTKAWAGLQQAWAEVAAFMGKTWAKFAHGATSVWRSTQNWLSKQFVKLMAQFDETIDVDLATSILDEEFKAEQAKRDAELARDLRDIEADRQDKLKDIEKNKEGALDILEEERQRRHNERRERHQKQQKELEEELEATKQAWQEALDAAAQAGKDIGGDGSGPPGGVPDAAGLQQAVKVSGTFNALALAGMGMSSPMERAARAGEETAKNTKRLVEQGRDGGVVFV